MVESNDVNLDIENPMEKILNPIRKSKSLKRNEYDPSGETHLITIRAFNKAFNSLNLSKDLKRDLNTGQVTRQ